MNKEQSRAIEEAKRRHSKGIDPAFLSQNERDWTDAALLALTLPALSTPKTEAVTVKPLEWTPTKDGGARAWPPSTPNTYLVEKVDNTEKPWVAVAPGWKQEGIGTMEAAMDVCMSHLSSCLSDMIVSPAPVITEEMKNEKETPERKPTA